MRRGHRGSMWVAVVLAALATAGAAADEGPLVLTGGPLPKALAPLGPIERPLAFTVGPDGWAAAAVAIDDKRCRIRWVRGGDANPREVELAGAVRSLLFNGDGSELIAVVRRERKRGRGETYLVRLTTATGDLQSRLALPASARGTDLTDTGLLVVASDGEIRTFRMPAFTSGPLFRLPGENWTVASLPAGERLLVGRADGLVIVDLDDPQSIDGLPVRERAALEGPIVGLAVAPDGERAVGRAADGRIFEVTLDPLSAVATGSGEAVAWPGALAPRPLRVGALAPREEPPLPPLPPPVEARPAEEDATSAPPAPRAEMSPQPAPPPPAPPIDGVAVRGTVTGSAVDLVAAVVLFGPDNVLREAARVRPSDDGRWSVGDLAPGGYRIVVQGEGGRVLETRPPFATARVEVGATVDVEPIEVVRAY